MSLFSTKIHLNGLIDFLVSELNLNLFGEVLMVISLFSISCMNGLISPRAVGLGLYGLLLCFLKLNFLWLVLNLSLQMILFKRPHTLVARTVQPLPLFGWDSLFRFKFLLRGYSSFILEVCACRRTIL